MGATNVTDIIQRLEHGGGGVAVADGDDFWPRALDRRLDLLRPEHRAPVRFDDFDLGAAAFGDFHLQPAEAAVDADQHRVAGFDEGDHRRLDPRPRGAVDQQGPGIGGLEHMAPQRHGFRHQGAEPGIELADQRCRHGPQHAGVRVDGPRPHEQAAGRIEVGIAFCHLGASGSGSRDDR